MLQRVSLHWVFVVRVLPCLLKVRVLGEVLGEDLSNVHQLYTGAPKWDLFL